MCLSLCVRIFRQERLMKGMQTAKDENEDGMKEEIGPKALAKDL